MIKYLCLLVIVWSLSVSQVLCDTFDECKNIMTHVVMNCQKIQNGHFLIKLFHEDSGTSKPELTWDIVFSHEKMLMRKKTERNSIHCVHCFESEGNVFIDLEPKLQYPSQLSKKEQIYSVFYTHNSKNKFIQDDYDYAIPSIRSLGFVPNTIRFSNTMTLDDYRSFFNVRNEENKNFVLEDSLIDEDKCKKISWDNISITEAINADTNQMKNIKIISTISIWIDVEKNYTVRQLEFVTNYSFKEIIKNEIQYHKPSGIWYPAHWIYERYSGRDKKLTRKENITLEVLSINEPKNDKVFDLSQIKEFEPGTTVRWNMETPPPAEGKLVWNGKKVVGLSEYKFGIATGNRNASRRMFLILVNVAGISAIIALQCLRVWRKQRR